MRAPPPRVTGFSSSPVVSPASPVGQVAMKPFVDSAHDRLHVTAGGKACVFENASTLAASSTVPAAGVEVEDDAVQSLAF